MPEGSSIYDRRRGRRSSRLTASPAASQRRRCRSQVVIDKRAKEASNHMPSCMRKGERSIVMGDTENLSMKAQRTRRNIVKMGAIAASAIPRRSWRGRRCGGASLFASNWATPCRLRLSQLLFKGHENSNRPRRAQGRRPGDWRFVADDVRRNAPHPVDRTLSIQEE